MLFNGLGAQYDQGCPVVGNLEDQGWNVQCPMYEQWSRQPVVNQCNYGDPNFMSPSVQCYRNSLAYQYEQNTLRYFTPPVQTHYIPPAPMIQGLPCQQQQPWDYDNMCYNVDGRPCQYTAVIDLEDMMNNEKRKEKSRVAARTRRNREMHIFAELSAALPARKEAVDQLDKASVMRLAISYLRVRDVVSLLPQVETEHPKIKNPEGTEEVSSELSYMKALDGFVLVLSQQGDIVYCSENIADHLGVSQMEIMGQSVFEFSHPCDHDEIRDALRSSDNGRRDLLLRMKCTLTSKGRNVHLKSASYKVIHITGHLLKPDEKIENNNNGTEDNKVIKDGSLVAVGRPIPHPSNIEVPLDSKTFLSKHSLDMKFTYMHIDDALMSTLGFEADELIGKSVYDYHHAADSGSLVHQFKSLFSKGQCETGQYRFLAKTGGYAWIQTQATVITDKQQKPISVVCVNYVISGIECKDEVFAAHQVQHADLKPSVAPIAPVPVIPSIQIDPPSNGAIVAVIQPEEERPIPVTESIFAPRKKEMNKGFLMFSEDEGYTMLKDEPEDLTHLAPTAGDACIPLIENSPFDMFVDDFIWNDNYCSLLGDDLANDSSVGSLSSDPLFSASPDPQENDSSCERSSLITDLSLDTFDSNRSDNETEDGNSPFIPSNDELPVLEPAVMWGALPDSVSLARPQRSEPQTVTSAPALQRLLTTSSTGPQPQDLITNIYSDSGLIPSRNVSTWDTGMKRVLKQEEEPCAKRAKRSPSPVQTTPRNPSSSVLMNLLDLQQQLPQAVPQQMVPQQLRPQYQIIRNAQQTNDNKLKNNIPISVINMLQNVPNQIIRSNTPVNSQMFRSNMTPSPMSPLSLNISPMYSLPSSPNSYNSPAISPAKRECVMSPYTPQSLSPASTFQQYSPVSRLMSPVGIMNGCDPYLTNKMQPSPGFLQTPEIQLDSVPLPNDFWSESDMMQGTSDLLTALDDVKLV